jgi:hypothetical protein
MRVHRREVGVPLLLGAGAFALAFAQRPGLATADTKINLHVDPGRFLADVASTWTSTGQLGDVQTGQQAGYLFPMGPFFAIGHAVGLPDWVVQRLWLGSLLALAAWGVVRLLDALLGRPRGVAHLVAGAVLLLNPFVVTYANRTTVTLLAYAALPWLLLVVHRGVRESHRWRWPAAFGLLVAASGGGINGAVTAWMLLGPVLLLLYELAFTRVGWSQARGFVWRAVLTTALTSLWWVVPAYVQSSYGIDFLHFTEQPGTIWGTTSATETLRLMSFWLSYVGIGFSGRAIPYFDDQHTLLFSLPVVIATLLIPAAALAGFVWSRRWRYGPFFLGLALVAALVVQAGFPDGTPLRHGLTFAYNHFASVRFLRASYKAAPLLAVALACLAGVAAGQGWWRLGVAWRRALGVLAVAGVLALAAWPLVTGKAQDKQVSYKRIPTAWSAAARDLDRRLPRNSRAIVLPGDLFSFYTWGGTVDPILPALSRRPVAERTEVPYADLRATDLLWTIDGLVHQRRLLPGQLAPLLSLIGVRAVVTGTDDDLARSDAPPPADAAADLAAQGLARPASSYGPVSSFAPSGLGPARRLPEVRRYNIPRGRGIVRVEPAADPIVVDGSAAALAGLAAFGALPVNRALLYAGDLSPAALRRAVASGGQVVISDSNRRQTFVPGTLDQNTGPVLAPSQGVSADGLILDPIGRGPAFQTVASFSGVALVQAPASPLVAQFPEHAPFAAIDGSTRTAWLADPSLTPDRHWLQVDFQTRRPVPYVDLIPYDDAGGSVRQVEVAGRRFAVHPGVNRLTLGLRAAAGLRVTLTGVSGPTPGATPGAGGIAELRIPGVRAAERLRLPVDAAAALAGTNLDRVSLDYLLHRTTGDDPFARDPAPGPYSARDVHDAGDAEQVMRRVFEVPAPRSFDALAWVTVFPQTPDDALDRLAGYRGPIRATSSSRFEGRPQWRASGALDGDPGTAWIGDFRPGVAAWLQWRTPGPIRISALTLRPATEPVRTPTLVRVTWPRGSTPPLRVKAGGRVTLPHPVRAAQLRIDVLAAAAPAGASAADRSAVGIADVGGAGATAHVARPHRGALNAPCGSVRVRVGGANVAMSVTGSIAAFEQGTPLRASSCGRPVALAAGTQQLHVAPGPFAVDELRLASPAPRAPTTASGSGRVLAGGTPGRGSYDGVRVSVPGPSWLVLGESYNRGWEAFCNGHSLGSPAPIDGYSNGWRVRPGCRQVRFAFAPNRVAGIAYLISGIAGLLCLIALVGSHQWRLESRRTAARDEREPHTFPARRAGAPWPVGAAIAGAGAAGLVFGFVFGVRAGIVSIPVTAYVLWRGIGARRLTLAAGLLLGVVVPLAYLVHPGSDAGGNHFGYATDHLAAHYAAVAALGLLTAALWRTLAGTRGRRRRSGSGTSDVSGPPPAPAAPAQPHAGSTGVSQGG